MNEQLRMAIPVLWPSMATAGAVLLVAWWPRWDKSGSPITPGAKGWAGALAFGLAFAAAFAVIVGGMPKFPPPEKWQWLLPIAGLATLCGAFAGLAERSAIARWVIGLASAACVGFAFHPLPLNTQPAVMQAIVGACVALVWFSMESSARTHRGFATPLLLSIVFMGVSIVILKAGNANISLMAASISATLGVACAIALLLPPLTLAGGATHVLSALLATLLALAWMYERGERASLVLLAATPIVLRLAEMFTRKSTGWKSFAVRFLATAIPVGIAIVIAVIAAAKEEANSYGM